MEKRPRRSLTRAAAGICAGVLAVTGLAAFATSASAAQNFLFTRLQGPDRYGTAAVIATQTFTTADTVLIANGEEGHFPDALAGNYLAGVTKSPILLTTPNTLPQYTINALTILKPTKAIILGGTSAVSATVASQLSGMGIGSVTRVGGLTRYDTAKMIAEQPGASGVGTTSGKGATAILANGANFPDALTAGPLSFAKTFPIVLTDPTVNGLSPQAQQTLTDLGIKNVLIAGGTAAVTPAAQTALGSGVSSQRLAGNTRQDTAVAIANYETANAGFGNTHINLARGDTFPDALAGGPHAGAELAPILLTNNPNDLGTPADSYLKAHSDTLTSGHIFGGTAAVSDAVDAQATADAKGTAAATAAVTNAGGTVAAGQPINFTITPTNGKTISSVAVTGPCVTGATSSTDTDTTTAGFQGSINANGNAAAGSCTLQFVVTFSDGTTATLTAPVTVTAGAASQTTRPELTSAAITGTVTASQVTPSNPLGTTVAYTFDEPVASATNPANFKIYRSDDTAVVGDTVVGVNGNVVTVRFTNVNTTTNGTPSVPAANVNNYTLATVVQGAATDSQGQTSPDGDAAIGTASSTGGTTATANTTTAPDLRSVGNFRQGSTANTTAVDFTFDQAAFTNATGTGFHVIKPDNTVVNCTGPLSTDTTTASGGTIAGGNGTTTITVLCPDANAGTATALSATNLVRATVDASTVASSTTAAAVTNPLEAVHFTGGTTAPDLVSATLIPRNTGTNTSTTQDQVLYTFDQAVTGTPDATKFGVFDTTGTPVKATGTPTVGGAGNMSVLVTFPVGTNASVDTVGAFVLPNAVSSNTSDERGTTPGSTSGGTTITPGQVQAPQLTAVALTSATDAFGAVTYTATYTFDKAIGTTAIATAGDFKLFDANGNQLTAMTCAPPTGATAANTSVACTAFTDANTSATTPALVQQDVGAATLGTVDAGAVTGLTAPNNNPNPEGAAATTGGTGTPTA